MPVAISPEWAVECAAVRARISGALAMPPASQRIEYALVASQESLDVACEGSSRRHPAGCVVDAWIAARRPLELHEIVHAHLLAGGAQGTAALQEGAAVVFGCGTPGSADLVPGELAPEQLASRDAFYAAARETYPASASFVSFLLDEHGEEAFVELLERTGGVDDLETLDAIALEVLGRSILDAHAAWSALPREPWHRVCRPAFACGSPPLDGAPTVTLVRGISDDVSRGGVLRTFVVERAAELHVAATGLSPRVEVLSCDRAPSPMHESSSTRELDAVAPIAPGRYALWLTGAILSADDATVRAELVVELR